MSDRDIFQKLIKNDFIPDITYSQYHFSFQTVFYRSSVSYRVCGCAFENEYLDYISETAAINEEMAYTVLQNIINGKCPHVDKVDQKCIRETSISAIHIATFVGNKQAIDDYFNDYKAVPGKIFRMSPYRLAIVKENISVIDLFHNAIGNRILMNLEVIPVWNLLYAQRNIEEKQNISFECLSAPELCVRKRNKPLLKAVLNPLLEYKNIHKAFGQAIKHGLKDMEKELTEYIQSIYERGRQEDAIKCVHYAIVNGHTELLSNMMKLAYSCESILMKYVSEACILMGRSACVDICKFYGVLDSKDEASKDLGKELSELSNWLHRYHDHSNIEDFQAYLKETFYKRSNPHIKLCGFCCKNIHPEVLKLILDLEAEKDNAQKRKVTMTNCVDGSMSFYCSTTPLPPWRLKYRKASFAESNHHYRFSQLERNIALAYLMSKRTSFECYPLENKNTQRENIERVLYENPSLALNRFTVSLAISLDETYESDVGKLHGDFIMDNEEHSCFGYRAKDCFALSFFAPLLLECGFRTERQLLVNALENKKLHDSERAYICHHLFSARSLKLRCRDVIRDYFEGRQLHKFVDTLFLPQTIKDFLLLNDILFSLKKEH